MGGFPYCHFFWCLSSSSNIWIKVKVPELRAWNDNENYATQGCRRGRFLGTLPRFFQGTARPIKATTLPGLAPKGLVLSRNLLSLRRASTFSPFTFSSSLLSNFAMFFWLLWCWLRLYLLYPDILKKDPIYTLAG